MQSMKAMAKHPSANSAFRFVFMSRNVPRRSGHHQAPLQRRDQASAVYSTQVRLSVALLGSWDLFIAAVVTSRGSAPTGAQCGQVTDWLQANSRGQCPKWTLKFSKGPPDCGATQMRYETHNSPGFACARVRLSDHRLPRIGIIGSYWCVYSYRPAVSAFGQTGH
jgi:hypothetical protein